MISKSSAKRKKLSSKWRRWHPSRVYRVREPIPHGEEWPHSCSDPLASSRRKILPLKKKKKKNLFSHTDSLPWFNITFLHRPKQIIWCCVWSRVNRTPQTSASLAFFWRHTSGLGHYGAGFLFSFYVCVSQPSDETWRGPVTTWFCLSFRCSRFQSEIKRLKISSPVRVCQNCYYNLQHERGSEDGPRNCWGFDKLVASRGL